MGTMKSSEKKLNKAPFQDTNEWLPDCVISYIFSKLSGKDLVKTSTLSKRWLHEWRTRMDLNFDIHNMFDSDTIREFHSISFFNNISRFQNEFAERVDQSMLYYQGAKIRSLKVNFPLGDAHSDVIGRLISQGIAKGIERIELLLVHTKTFRFYFPTNPYKFSYTLLSESDSLKYLHLQHCLLVPPMDFSGLKKLQTLVLQQVTVEQDMLLGLFSNCIHLVDLTLQQCKFKSDINITSSSLRHLDIIDRNHPYQLPRNMPLRNIKIDALNLSSFDYSCHMRISSIKAPRLSKLFWGATEKEEISYSFDLIASLQQLENLVMSMSHSHVAKLPKELGPFENLRQLEFSIYGEYNRNVDYLRILDIVMASPHLQKLFLTISRPHLKHPLPSVAYQRIKREYMRFCHNELKYVELRGCVGPIHAIKLASHFLNNVNSLKQITFSSCDRFYIGAGRWTKSIDCPNCLGCYLVREILKDEVVAAQMMNMNKKNRLSRGLDRSL